MLKVQKAIATVTVSKTKRSYYIFKGSLAMEYILLR